MLDGAVLGGRLGLGLQDVDVEGGRLCGLGLARRRQLVVGGVRGVAGVDGGARVQLKAGGDMLGHL